MGVHKASSSKAAKKSSKSGSSKSPGSMDSSASTKKSAASEKPTTASQKKSSAASKVQPGKPSPASKVSSNPSAKSGGKSKVQSPVVQSSKSGNSVDKKAIKAGSLLTKKLGVSSRLESLGESVCREVACEGLATSGGYCRLHYIKNWRKIKRKELILREKKLNQYIEELVAKYPDKYIEAIRQDLASDKDFAKVIYDLDLDEGVEDFDIEGGESVDSLIDTIKRDFDDEGETY